MPKTISTAENPSTSTSIQPQHSLTLTAEQAAAQVGTTVRTIHKWLHLGKLTGVKPGGDKLGWRIPQSEIDRILGTPT